MANLHHGYEVLCGRRGDGVDVFTCAHTIEVIDADRTREALMLLMDASDPAIPVRLGAIRYFHPNYSGMVIRYEAWQ